MSIRAKEALIRTETKKAMEEALGAEAPLTETEFTKKLNDAAGDAVADKMGVCMRNAGNDPAAIDRCRTEEAKKALEDSLGKIDVSQEDIEGFLKKGAENAVKNAMSQ